MRRQMLLVGNPNVGKSVIFNRLTGRYVNVSNYPGTTVEVANGQSRIAGQDYEVIDTPGMYSLSPLTAEEEVTRQLLFSKNPAVVVQVLDAKNIRRMLNLTLQLIAAGLPVVVDLNLMDEARRQGVSVNVPLLAEVLGVPVVATTAVEKNGLQSLKQAIGTYRYHNADRFKFSEPIEQAVSAIVEKLTPEYIVAKRMVALLLLEDDKAVNSMVAREAGYNAIVEIINTLAAQYAEPLALTIAVERQKIVDALIRDVVAAGQLRRPRFFSKLDRLTREPLTGVPILAVVLYFGLYKIVGGFGAGVLVDYINENIFGVVTPLVMYAADQYLPWAWMKTLLVGQFGMFTFGLRYAVAIILPVVGTFFIVFAVLEDSGYLPRLAMLVDGLFKKIGLNGRAVIPMVLGLGCGTMAVFVTRTLETKRERILATFLLSLAIPCSAQLGVVLALLAHSKMALFMWTGYIMVAFGLVGWLGAKILPGRRSPFYMELPPLRWPRLGNVVMKAYTRMTWYFVEIIPVFILVSGLLWFCDQTGALTYIITAAQPIMVSLGLPPEAAQTFLLGFFRRDYGAAGLYDLTGQGLLDDRQLLVAAVTLTLFVPCVAQLMVMIKEQGSGIAITMMTLIALSAWLSGWLMLKLCGLVFF